MYQPTPWGRPGSSFGRDTVPAAAACADPPLVAVYLNADWLPYLLGAAQQLCAPAIWDAADSAALLATLQAAADLVQSIGIAALDPAVALVPLSNGADPAQFIQRAASLGYVYTGTCP